MPFFTAARLERRAGALTGTGDSYVFVFVRASSLAENLPFLAWTYLKDHDAAHDPMNNAVENASDYLLGAG